MKRCSHVILVDNICSHKLEKIEKGRYKLKEIEGLIIFCERNNQGLVMALNNESNSDTKKIIWPYGNRRPLPAICGQGLRGFYEETYRGRDVEEIKIDAYELTDGKDYSIVLRRGTKPSANYKFVDFVKVVID